jgi:hypothetical protein
MLMVPSQFVQFDLRPSSPTLRSARFGLVPRSRFIVADQTAFRFHFCPSPITRSTVCGADGVGIDPVPVKMIQSRCDR